MSVKANKKDKAVQRTIYVPQELDDRLSKYIANRDNDISYSGAISNCIKNFLKVYANKEELTITTEIIENTIRKELKPTVERITKAGYSSIFLQAQVLAYLFNSEEQHEFMKKVIDKAEAMGYQAIKNYSLDEDITKMFPKGLKIEDLI